MSGGSLYAAMWMDTMGRWASSGDGKRREWRTRQTTSQVSKANVDAMTRAEVSSTSSAADANTPSAEKWPAKVTSAANPRYERAAAAKLAKKYWPSGFHSPRNALTATTTHKMKASLHSTGADASVQPKAAR